LLTRDLAISAKRAGSGLNERRRLPDPSGRVEYEPLDLARILRGCSVWPALLSLTRSCGGIEQGFGPIGAGDLAVSQGGPELAVSCATSSDG